MRVSWVKTHWQGAKRGQDETLTGTVVEWLVVPQEDTVGGLTSTYYNPSAIVAVDDGSFETIRIEHLTKIDEGSSLIDRAHPHE